MAASGKKNMFNEATRVQMPAMVHLTRLGYTYFGKITEDMAGTVYDPDTNILIDVFKEQFARLNPTHVGEAEQTLKTIRQELDNDDIGRSFYERLSSVSPVRLVDFENPQNNTYHFTAEFTCKRDQDEFRPDITLFVNGLPLVFVEVKKPNNHGGMVAESKRMNQKRFPNKKFRRFLNITQLMIFSNNMEYDTMGGIVPVQGAFYCTTAKQSAPFNCFREENPTNLDIAPYNADFPYKDIDSIVEKKILTDFNCQVIHTSPEYQTNLDTYTPTNRVLTCQKYRPSDEEHSLPVVKIREMNGGITNDTERVSSTIPAKNIISSGDILFSWSASLEVIMWYGVDAGLNQHIFKVVPKSYFSSEYVYLQLSEYLIHFIKIAEARKTTMGHITSEHLQDSHIILPPANIIKNFSEYVRPIYQMKKQIANETSELIKLRDWLIPMLMNGQATISD